MNYQRIYDQLCARGQIRKREEGVFYERHHILPKCMGGGKGKNNMSLLTLKEHYIAHRLLVSIHPKSIKLNYALWSMCNIDQKYLVNYERYKPSARVYNRIRTEYMTICKGINSPMYGKKASLETRAKISRARTGLPGCNKGSKWSMESRKKFSESKKGQKGRSKSQEERNRMSEYWIKRIAEGYKTTPHYGHKATDKMKEDFRTLYGKNIIQITLDDQYIKEWQSSNEAMESLKIDSTTIRKCCRKDGYKTAGGYKWMYASEYYKNKEEIEVDNN